MDEARPESCENPHTYRKCSIWHRKRISGNKWDFIYTYRDDLRRNELRGNFVESSEKECGETEHVPMDVLKETWMGNYSFCSNPDIDPKDLYLQYKQRWNIEECFYYLKNSVSSRTLMNISVAGRFLTMLAFCIFTAC